MPRSITLALFFLLPAAAWGSPRDVQLLAWSTSGETALVLETVYAPDGGSSASYRVVGPGVLQERHVVSHEMSVGEGPLLQRVSPEACREALLALKKVLRVTRFKGVELRGEECAQDRAAGVAVSPELAAAAELGNLDGEGGVFPAGDWRIRVERTTLLLEGPAGSKRLQLPRPIAPEAAHVLLSPSRRLLLLLVSTATGEQVLHAGYASKTGSVADYQ